MLVHPTHGLSYDACLGRKHSPATAVARAAILTTNRAAAALAVLASATSAPAVATDAATMPPPLPPRSLPRLPPRSTSCRVGRTG